MSSFYNDPINDCHSSLNALCVLMLWYLISAPGPSLYDIMSKTL